MDHQKRVLLVTNATTDTEISEIKKAIVAPSKNIHNIKLSLVHVIPTLPTCYFNIPSMVLLAERYYEEAKKSLTFIGDLLQIPQRDQWLITGRLRPEVLRLASKLNTQFILASSNTIPDLHRSYFFSREKNTPPIKTITNLISL